MKREQNVKLKGTLTVSAALMALLASTTVAAAPPSAADESFARGRILVMPRAGLSDGEFGKALAVHGGKARRIGNSNLHIVDLPANASEQSVVARLAHNPHFKFAELDRRGTVAFVANDPYVGSQWHLTKMGVPTAWDTAQGSGITIAILDTGVDGSHPDLSSHMVAGWNFADNNANTADVMGHGTKAAGAAAAISNNSIGVAGIAGQSKIMPIRVTAPNGSFYYSAVAAGLTFAADNGAKVANMSIYGALNSSSIISAAQYMKNKGGLVVTSAGNNGINEGWSASTSMIPVSATSSNDAVTGWSSYGGFVAMSAPGTGIWTTTSGGGYASVSGTSFSSPVTAGVVALMMAANPQLANTEVEQLLYATAVDLGTAGRDIYYGHGRVDAGAAVQAARAATSTADTTRPTAAISNPLSNATVSGLVSVDVSASDNVGVVRVELWVNGTKVATDTVTPYGFSWDSTTVANGLANLIAHAYDAAGNSRASSTVTVNVANAVDTTPPAVAITNPGAGSKVTRTVSVRVSATDDSGSAGITQYLYIDGTLKASATGSSVTYRWNTRKVAAGTHTIQAVAKDAAGNTSSTSIQVTK